MNRIIKRPVYLERIKGFIDKQLIKVIVGQRRVGKSYLLKQIAAEILENNPEANILFVDKELIEFDFIKNHLELYSYVTDNLKNEKNYLFVDEIQDIADFEKAIRSLHNERNVDVFISGSNANLLSGELATFLSGRYIEFRISPLSYTEFLTFHKLVNTNDSLMSYLRYGGLPFLIHLEKEEQLMYEYLKNIYSTIIYKDIVKRFNVRNISFLESLVVFLANHIGSLVSAKKVSDFLKSQQVDISPRIVLNYLSHFNNAFFINRVRRYEIAGKKIFETGAKYYFEDLGLRNAISGFKQVDIGKIIENAVYNHLIICGYQIEVGQLGSKEIDFICQKKNEKIYVQVAYLLVDEKTVEREYGNLLIIGDNYPKYVVTMDDVNGNSYEGITHMHLREFLTRFN